MWAMTTINQAATMTTSSEPATAMTETPALQAIRSRRSIKQFTDRPVTREQLETLLDAAVLAPNHHLTQPWRFYVLGPRARRAYGEVLGNRKAKKLEDANAAQLVRDKVAAEHEALPAMIAVAMRQD